MAKNKSESKKSKEEVKDNEMPKLVEVYGDDVVEEKKSKNDNSEIKKEEKDEDRQGFKTEVVEVLEKKEMNDNTEDREDNVEVKQKEVEKEEVKEEEEKEKDDEAFDDEIGSQRKAVRGVFGVGLIVFLVIFGITGWAFYLKTIWLPKETVSEVVVEATPNPEATPTPVPTPEPLAREDITLEILNGTGETGLAGSTGDIFEELGYVVDSLGNTESTNENELYVLESELDKLSVLYEDVLEELSISSPSGYLDEDAAVTARIILGN